MQTISKIDLGHSSIFLREDGIIEIDCADNFEYDVLEIKHNLSCIKMIAGNNKVLILNNAKAHTTITKEGREFLATGPHIDFVKAEAFIIHIMGQWILANFFLKINKPIVPAAFFKNKEDAEVWLKTFND